MNAAQESDDIHLFRLVYIHNTDHVGCACDSERETGNDDNAVAGFNDTGGLTLIDYLVNKSFTILLLCDKNRCNSPHERGLTAHALIG